MTGKKTKSAKERVRQLEKQLADAIVLQERLGPGKGPNLPAHIRKLRRLLEIEKSHAVSGFNSIRHYTVSGSYGGGKKSR